MSARKDRPRDLVDADAVRRRQLLLFSAIAAVLLVAVAAWLGMGGGKERAPAGGIEAEIAGPDAAEKVWTRRSEARLGGIETQIREIQQEARTLRADNERLLHRPYRRQLAVPAGGRRGVRQCRRGRSGGAGRARGGRRRVAGAALAGADRGARDVSGAGTGGGDILPGGLR